MPFRGYSREQDWLFPPSLSEMVAGDHPVRFVAEFVDALDLEALGVRAKAASEGAPAFHPRALLAAWLYAFMVRMRSSRQVERACRENIPLMWLTGLQRPDHVTLWRFYAANRKVIRSLLKETVQLAITAGLVDFVLQAVDGSRVAIGSAASLRDQAGVAKLLGAVEAEIAELERANAAPQPPAPVVRQRQRRLLGRRARLARLQQALAVAKQRSAEASPWVRRRAQKRSQRVATPRAGVEAVVPGAARAATPTEGAPEAPAQFDPAPAIAGAATAGEPRVGTPAAAGELAAAQGAEAAGPQVSITDPEAQLLRGRHGFCVGYNSQAVVDGKAQIVVAADVVDSANDLNQLAAMLAEATAMTERGAQAAVADVGYASITDIVAAQSMGTDIYVADHREDRKDGPVHNPYHKAHFVYDAERDSYVCPLGQRLPYYRAAQINGQQGWTYRGQDCQGCPAQASGACTTAQQRSVTRFATDEALAAHAAKMQGPTAREMMSRRKAIVEPVFGLLREQLGLLRYLVRGLEKVKAEWRLLCVAHNLRKLWKLWWRPKVQAALAANR